MGFHLPNTGIKKSPINSIHSIFRFASVAFKLFGAIIMFHPVKNFKPSLSVPVLQEVTLPNLYVPPKLIGRSVREATLTYAGTLSNSSMVINAASLMSFASFAGFFAHSGCTAFACSSCFPVGTVML